MISYSEALDLIKAHPLKLLTPKIPLAKALGRVLAKEVMTAIDLPPFDNSAVDGYAINAASFRETGSAVVNTVLRAQLQEGFSLQKNTAAKIMTGAPLPKGADAVLMKEEVALDGDILTSSSLINPHDNVRFLGEDIKKGSVAAKMGTLLTPQLIALLYGLGEKEVTVFKAPSLHIISTGDELVLPGSPLGFGQVYYLMGPMLKAQGEALGLENISFTLVPDEEKAIIKAIEETKADIVLLTGGMSKGDYDFVRSALKKCAVDEVFYQGYWRPGKPLFFGRLKQSYFFGLPGNPVAAFVCFHIFVRKLILQGMQNEERTKLSTGVLANDFRKKPEFTFFARAYVNENNELFILPGQGSHQIYNLSTANALALIESGKGIVKAKEIIQYFPI